MKRDEGGRVRGGGKCKNAKKRTGADGRPERMKNVEWRMKNEEGERLFLLTCGFPDWLQGFYV